MGIGVKDQTGSRNLIRRKDVNPALAQFALIFQKHEFLIYILSWNKSEIMKLVTLFDGPPTSLRQQNIFSFGPPNYSK